MSMAQTQCEELGTRTQPLGPTGPLPPLARGPVQPPLTAQPHEHLAGQALLPSLLPTGQSFP